jgi:hypothetical protein
MLIRYTYNRFGRLCDDIGAGGLNVEESRLRDGFGALSSIVGVISL